MKTPHDECGWYSGKQMFMLLPMGDMAQVKNNQLGAFWEALKLKVSEYMAGLYYVPYFFNDLNIYFKAS